MVFKKSLFDIVVVALLFGATILTHAVPATAQSTPVLRYVSSTSFQIAVAWDPVPGASSYIIDRSRSSTFGTIEESFTLGSSLNGFGDTGSGISFAGHFRWPGTLSYASLQAGVSYSYRLRAQFPSAPQKISNTITAQLAGVPPPRGIEGDQYADVVLGQPNFGENVGHAVNPFATSLIGGLILDSSVTPNRVYMLDTLNNRVLGLSHLGQCEVSGINCTSSADCQVAGRKCVSTPGLQPEVLLGQPNFESAACNGDSTGQFYPGYQSVYPDRLCLQPGAGVSPEEALFYGVGRVDSQGRLYVVDRGNNRALIYDNPFSSTTTPQQRAMPDQVIGQADFTSGKCNRGNQYGNASSLCMGDAQTGSLAVDPSGNLWVVDSGMAAGMNRVLRFPKNPATGLISSQADFVLGQDTPNSYFYERAWPTESLQYLLRPQGIAIDPQGNIYISELRGSFEWGSAPSRVLRYNATAISAAIAAGQQTVAASEVVFPIGGPAYSAVIAYDATRNGLWMLKTRSAELYSLTTKQLIKRIGVNNNQGHWHGIAVHSSGDVFIADAWSFTPIRIYENSIINAAGVEISESSDRAAFFGGSWPTTGTHLSKVTGVLPTNNQLIVTDGNALYYWNNRSSIASSQAATGTWQHGTLPIGLDSPKLDSQNRLWFTSLLTPASTAPGVNCPVAGQCIHRTSLPLSATSPRDLSISVATLTTLEGQTYTRGMAWDSMDVAPIGNGSKLWLQAYGHVVRLVNLDGSLNPNRGPYVDIVLGKPNLAQIGDNTFGCSQIFKNSFCQVISVALDAEGNLWVAEKPPNEDIIGTRLLKFSADLTNASRSSTLFGADPIAVYGTNDKFTVGTACYNATATDWENGCHLLSPAFGPGGIMVTGANWYGMSPFPLVFLSPTNEHKAQLLLGDYVAAQLASAFDAEGNLYLGDRNWNRVLIYKKPLLHFGIGGGSAALPSPPINLRIQPN